MDKQALIAYLKEIDEYGALESPSHESRSAGMKDVKAAHQALKERFNLHLHCDITQDASFVGSLTQTIDREHRFRILFSKFGRLFTIEGAPQSYIDSFPIDGIIEVLEGMNFVYVPMEILELPYEGPNQITRLRDLSKHPRWWDRYFEYL